MSGGHFEITEQLREEVFVYLDNLRESGQINMFGAAAWVREVYALPKTVAQRLHKEWMSSFADRHRPQ